MMGRGDPPKSSHPPTPKATPKATRCPPTLRQVLGAVDAELERGGARRRPQQVGLHVLVRRRFLLLLGGMRV